MSIPELNAMRELLKAAATETEQWQQQQSQEFHSIPAHRISIVRDKIQALSVCDSAGLLQTGFTHVFDSASALGIPICDLAPSLLQLSALLDRRQQT